MDNLPLELMSKIIDFVPHVEPNPHRGTKPKLACLALISERWRQLVESRAFSSIKINNEDLDAFASVYKGESNARRRAYLQILHFTVVRPPHIDAKLKHGSRAEWMAEKQRNNEAYTAAFATLFYISSSRPYSPANDRSIVFVFYEEMRDHARK